MPGRVGPSAGRQHAARSGRETARSPYALHLWRFSLLGCRTYQSRYPGGRRMATSHGSALLQPDDGSVTPGSARSLLFTILGELVWPTGKPVWTATLVQVLRGLGIEEQTTRQAIARAASSDWITAARTGREVSWSLTPKLQRIFESGSLRVYSLSDSYSQWD